MNEENIIKTGDHIIIQRQNYSKLHKLKSNGTVSLGKDVVELENVIGKKYYSTFRMVVRPKNKRVYTLEESEFTASIQNVNIDKSGEDNRNIIDDGSSQQLTTDEIHKLRDDALSSSDIVEKLITNSKTFNEKTEYSQEKYLKKKEKKYFEFIQIRKPTLRLLADLYYRQDPGKVQGVRIDDLSQILSFSNIHCDSKVLLYDSGTNGLLPAAITNALGKNTTGSLIHMHPGNVCQKEAFLALKFQTEQSERCINVCLYSVLRCFYQEFQHNVEFENISKTTEKTIEDQEMKEEKSGNKPEKVDKITTGNNKRKLDDNSDGHVAKRACWQIDNERACRLLSNKVDALVIVAKEHPTNIVDELLQFLDYGKPFVIFSLLREVLEELYVHIKSKVGYIGLNLSNNLLRNYQVLENRTHPDVNMNSGGYLLTGFKIDCRDTDK